MGFKKLVRTRRSASWGGWDFPCISINKGGTISINSLVLKQLGIPYPDKAEVYFNEDTHRARIELNPAGEFKLTKKHIQGNGQVSGLAIHSRDAIRKLFEHDTMPTGGIIVPCKVIDYRTVEFKYAPFESVPEDIEVVRQRFVQGAKTRKANREKQKNDQT